MAAVFATLIPANPLAKMAFSDAFDCRFRDLEVARTSGVHVDLEQTFDEAVGRFRRQAHQQAQRQARRQAGSDMGGDLGASFASESSSDVDTGPEDDDQGTAGLIWTGRFVFDFDSPTVPAEARFGWTVGKGRIGGVSTDFVLVDWRFAREYDVAIHGIHARFNFCSDNAMFSVSKANRRANVEVSLDGQPVGLQPAMLSKSRMAVRIGQLQYWFEYTDYSRSPAFGPQRDFYLQQFDASVLNSGAYIPPTPHPVSRTFASFTIMEPLGRGGFGKVFSACNSRGRVVAIKILECNRRNNTSISYEIRILQELTELAHTQGGRQYLVQLVEVLRASGDRVESLATPFEDIGLVMEPVTPLLLSSPETRPLRVGMLPDVASLFHGVLTAVNFLHKHGWIHGDLKKANIGLVGNPLRPILLDLGGAIKLARPGSKANPKAGSGGTVGYLAPERELLPYDALVDVWALGVIGYELARGHHPWKLSINPWRPELEYSKERPKFHRLYNLAIALLDQAAINGVTPPHAGVLIEPLLKDMLRHPWAQESRNNQSRISIEEALQHKVWSPDPNLPHEGERHQDKRPRA